MKDVILEIANNTINDFIGSEVAEASYTRNDEIAIFVHREHRAAISSSFAAGLAVQEHRELAEVICERIYDATGEQFEVDHAHKYGSSIIEVNT